MNGSAAAPRHLLAVLLGCSLLACGATGEAKSDDPDLPPQLAKLLAEQEKLPPESLAALQDLRLVAAVQLTHFTERGGYLTPQQLQQDGYLDPEWPRAPAEAYNVNCELRQEGAAFVCFADALETELDWYRTDSSQTIRWSADGRPTDRSPVFGVGEEE